MRKFFSNIFKNKKVILSLLLVFVVAGIILPQVAFAGDKKVGEICKQKLWGYECAEGLECHVASTWGNVNKGVCVVIGSHPTALERNTDILDPIAKAIVGVILMLPLTLAGLLSFVAGTMLNIVIELSTTMVSYTAIDPKVPTAVSIGWPIARNLANMIIVLALITIALATIIRYQAYEAKKLLPRLIVAALLINFSLVMCGVVIDASNVTMVWLLKGGQVKGTPVQKFISQDEANNFKGLAEEAINIKGPTSLFVAKIVGNIFYFVTKAIVAFLYVFLFLFRIFALWILVILSPIALACYVLPMTKSMVFDKWLKNFLEWCFIGVLGAFFMYLGSRTNEAMTNAIGFNKPGVGIAGTDLANLFSFFVPGMFMIIGFVVSIQISAMGSKMAIQAGNWTKKQIVGGAKGFGGSYGRLLTNNRLTRKTGLNYLGDKLSSGGYLPTKIGERLGFVRQGTATKTYQDKMAAKVKPYKELAEAEKDNDVVAQRAMNAKSAPERAAYTQVLFDRKKLNKIEIKDRGGNILQGKTAEMRQRVIDNAGKHGIDTSKFTDADYRYAEHDDKILRRIETVNGWAEGDPRAKAAARQEQLETNLSGMSPEARRNIDISDISPDLIVSKSMTANYIRNNKTADRAHIDAYRDPAIRARLRAEIRVARAAKNRTEVNRLKNIRKEIEDLP